MRTLLLLACGCLASAAPAGWCAIPASERTVLLNLYASTDGANWNINTGWNGPPGTECTWHGVTCDATATHVTDIVLTENELSGTLPALDGLTSLRRFYVMNNKLVGALPSLSGLPSLQRFNARNNRLTGAIPSLTGLTNLQDFTVQINQLTGTIPSLAGLSSLQFFFADNNQLSGAIPSLAGLVNLQHVSLSFNRLDGSIPPVAGLTSLIGFLAMNNQLTGTIPSIAGLPNLRNFNVSVNQLTGPIPPLAALPKLSLFAASDNQLTGSIPSLAAVPGLETFLVYRNQLTGSIPPLAGMTNLQSFGVTFNQLTGPIPALTGLPNLRSFGVAFNQLSGTVPPGAPLTGLQANASRLCPNYLNHTVDLKWDAATGSTPWYSNCVTPTAFSGPTATGTGTATASLVCAGTPRCFFTKAAWIPGPGGPGAPPPDSTIALATFPNGLFDFTLYGDNPGFTATLTLTYPQPLPAGTVYYKFGPTSGNPVPHWYVLPASISGNTVLFSITDGGLGDDDLLANSAIIDQGGPASGAAAVEYYHAAFDHFFSTANPEEIAKLDNGTFNGWARTGLSFEVLAKASAGATSVCRFFSTAFGPKSSHFYTPFDTECTTVKSNPDWQFEGDGDQVFYVRPAAGDGTCASGTRSIYRLFNNGQGGAPNHRYTTDVDARAEMLSRGWTLEGNGPGLAFMCTP